MANEAICYELPTKYCRYTVVDGQPIAKGTLLSLTSANTVGSSDGVGSVFGGVAWMEKVASDGTTEICAAIDGTFGLLAVGSITVGYQVRCGSLDGTGGPNSVMPYVTLGDEVGVNFGRALETSVGSTVIKVRLGGI